MVSRRACPECKKEFISPDNLYKGVSDQKYFVLISAIENFIREKEIKNHHQRVKFALNVVKNLSPKKIIQISHFVIKNVINNLINTKQLERTTNPK